MSYALFSFVGSLFYYFFPQYTVLFPAFSIHIGPEFNILEQIPSPQFFFFSYEICVHYTLQKNYFFFFLILIRCVQIIKPSNIRNALIRATEHLEIFGRVLLTAGPQKNFPLALLHVKKRMASDHFGSRRASHDAR